PAGASPGPVAKRGVVKIRQGPAQRCVVSNLWALVSREAQVKQVADEVRMACMLDAELHGDIQLLGNGTELHELLFVEGCVLAINGDEIIGVSAQNILEPLAVGRDRGRDTNDDLPLVDALLERVL